MDLLTQVGGLQGVVACSIALVFLGFLIESFVGGIADAD
jgi:hypothetical protein